VGVVTSSMEGVSLSRRWMAREAVASSTQALPSPPPEKDDCLTDVAELLATELISNAVRHTKGPAALRLRRRDGVLRVGEWDANPEPPDPAPALDQASLDAESGRGLTLVQACADVWGRHPLARGTDRGKYVWCDLGAA